jgi:hypothetical protein
MMRPRILRRALLALPALLVAPPAPANPPPGRGGGGGGQGRGNQGGGNQGRGNAGGGQGNAGRGGGQGQGNRAEGRGPGGFRPDDQALVRTWAGANPGWSPRPLPPGQMRQLARGRPLPPGIARQQVPPGLLATLPVYPGHSYAMIGTSLVLLGAGGVVVDIMAGLF